MGTPSKGSVDQNPSSQSEEPDHSECMRILNLVLDEEASDEQRAYFEKHLENCMPYYEIYSVDRKIKELIKKNCSNKEVPNDLVQSIKEKIFQKAD